MIKTDFTIIKLNTSLQHPRDQISEIIKRIYEAQITTTSGGNISILVTGDALLQTFDRLEVAEFSAKSLIMANPLGSLVPINHEQIKNLRDKFLS